MSSTSEPLYCTFCHQYFQIPVALQCGHHMCAGCVAENMALQLLKKENFHLFADSNSIPPPFVCQVVCQTCTISTAIRNSSELRVNEALQATVERVIKFKKCSLPRCNREPEVDCVPCQRSLCIECFDKLHNLIEEHDKSPLGTIKKLVVNTCTKHNKPYEFFCKTCEMQLCNFCLLIGTAHKEHDITSINEYSQLCIGSANEILERTVEKKEKLISRRDVVYAMLNVVRSVHEGAEKTINDCFNRLLHAVEERKNQLLQDSLMIRDAKISNLDQQATCINALANQLIRYADSLKYHSEINSQSDMIWSRQRINVLLKTVDDLYLEPCYNESLNLFAETIKIIDLVSKFGCVNLKPAKISPPEVKRKEKEMVLIVTWLPYGYAENSRYQVKLVPENEQEEPIIIYTGKSTSCLFINAAYNKNYQFIVQALNDLGEGMESDPSAPFMIEPIKTFAYTRDFDENGLIYWLGTDYGTSKRFRNPATTGKIEVTCSSMNSGTPELATGRIDAEFNTCNMSKSWITFNLKGLSIIPDRYSIKHGGTTPKPDYMRNWDFLGSKDGDKWILLRRHSNDDSGFSWALTNIDEDYSFFRITQTGKTSRGTDYLETRGFFEIYGKLVKE